MSENAPSAADVEKAKALAQKSQEYASEAGKECSCKKAVIDTLLQNVKAKAEKLFDTSENIIENVNLQNGELKKEYEDTKALLEEAESKDIMQQKIGNRYSENAGKIDSHITENFRLQSSSRFSKSKG